ncbi:hypothetical protein Hypma_011923 [Hypsizygus marmoreus]|uniref:Uncharacterized protein n=1 Tax=Hypsizygus marmoreus TaxID=39966 RepID=A0A369JNH2_HYPMA|nr:hypothetical protein Hypma_011923 [Hypsizygus marmoreus]
MHLTLLLTTVFVTLCALAAPLPTDNNARTTLSQSLSVGWVQPAFSSHQTSTHQRVVISHDASSIHARAPASGTKAAITKIPSVEEIKPNLRTAPNKLLFYSGPGGYINLASARAKSMGLKILEESWVNPTYPDKYSIGPDSKKFWDNASQALAEKAAGTVYVLLSSDTKGTNFFPGAIWARVEWPTLTKNRAVTKIVKINPDNDSQEVIFPQASSGSLSRSPSRSSLKSPSRKASKSPSRKSSKS